MRLLIACQGYYPSVGGVQEVMRQIAIRLAARGHDVTVATGPHAKRPPDTRIDGVRVVSFSVHGTLVTGLRGDVAAYREFVLSGNFDAVLIKAAQQWSFDALIPVLGRIPSRKVFIPCGFSGLYAPAFREYFEAMDGWLTMFDALIFYSGTYRDFAFARACGLSNLHIIPNGADEGEFATLDDEGFRRALDIPATALLMLSVGSRIAAKGHWEIVRAYDAAPLERPTALLICCNEPPQRRLGRFLKHAATGRPPLQLLARWINSKHRGRKQVIVADPPRADVVRAFKAADMFVFASHVEYSPLVLFESIAAGTPFLSAPVGNSEEIAKWTGSGVIYPAQRDANGNTVTDVSVLAQHMTKLASADDELSRLGENGRRAFLERGFSWASIASQYEVVLRPH